MAISTTVIPSSQPKLGIIGETAFGTLLDTDGTDANNYNLLPMVQAPKPTFNIFRESRLLSGRGTAKNAADTVISRKNGTVTCPFDFLATPELLLQHLTMVTNTYNADGSNVYTVEVDGTNNLTQVGGAISGKIPHTVNLAYRPAASEGIVIPGTTVSDLTLSCDYGADGGNLRMSGNYFSGFPVAYSDGKGCLHDVNLTGTWAVPDEGIHINMGTLKTKQLILEGNDQDMILKSWSMTIANGVNRVGSDHQGNAEAYAFPEYTVTGNVVVKYDGEFSMADGVDVVSHFLDGNVGTLALKFGDNTVSSAGEMNILAEVQYTGDPTQDMGEGGIFWNIPFECVVNSSTEALAISLFSDTAIGSM
tara:strand:+ start:253 stop:1341 length:1089 start_codon:yes stop_codon:yes gene_type:complete